MYDLKGKTALITGASSGLGEQFARALSGAGARVLLAARGLDKLEALALELGNARGIQMDTSVKKSVFEAFNTVENMCEKIDICINNAGIFKTTPIFEQDTQGDFEAVMQTNVLGVWYVLQAVAQHMKRHAISGSIINIGSINGANLVKSNRAGYCASKAAVQQITKALVTELSPHKIRINSIVPGSFHTPATDYRISTPELKAELEASIPLGFFAEPNDLDGLILYLASNQASKYVTGADFTIDGGMSWGYKA